MKALLAFLILGVAACATVLLVVFQPEPESVAPERPVTRVKILTVEAEPVQLTISSQGNVLPKIETDLSAEVSGRVIHVNKQFRPGGDFEKGASLLTIDPADYEAAVTARAAEVANARLNLAQETALAEQAAADWAALGNRSEPNELTLRKPQLAYAEALLASAQAALRQAERNLERTRIVAPYDGLVLSQSADLGQYITANPAAPIARIYATGHAEVRLPLTEREAELLDWNRAKPARVQFYSDKAVSETEPDWSGRLVRTEASLDTQSRLLYVVAEIDGAFGAPAETDGHPLRRGQFVRARIEGREFDAAFVLPRYALRGSNSVYVLTDDNKLQTRSVKILQSNTERVVIHDGLESGERVAVSPIAYFIENMPVEVVGEKETQ